MFNFLKSMFSSDGGVSMMRVTSFMTILTVLGTWVYKNVTSINFVDFGSESAMVILFVLGAKTVQKFSEVAGKVKEKELDKAE